MVGWPHTELSSVKNNEILRFILIANLDIYVAKETSSLGFAFFVEWKFVGSNVEEISLLILETKILTIHLLVNLGHYFLMVEQHMKDSIYDDGFKISSQMQFLPLKF